MRAPKHSPTSGIVQAGDTLVFANKKKAKVINLLWLNGQRGVQVDDPNALFLSDRFHMLDDVESYVASGLWKVKRGA